MEKTWLDIINDIKNKPYGNVLFNFIEDEYRKNVCYPPRELLFNAFDLTPINEVKVVLVGQDPYHEPGQAMGLCFSVPKGIKIPPSLKNIYKELENEYKTSLNYVDGDLTYLAKQGVLLLNSVLSVRAHLPLSHNIKEYSMFLKDIFLALDVIDRPIIFMLWGGNAKKLKKYINNPNHYVLEANHPSPLSANRGGWFGCDHFLKCNEILKKHHIDEISWIKK